MMTDVMDELLELARENNEMLKEILGYVRKVNDPKYKDNENMNDFLMNIVANSIVERLFENQQNFNNRFFRH